MGWLYSYNATRRDIIASVRRDPRILKSCIRGNCLWSLIRIEVDDRPVKLVQLHLLGTDGQGNWGYKDIDETMGPYYHSCPLGYIDAASEPLTQWSADWRERVRSQHARKVAPC